MYRVFLERAAEKDLKGLSSKLHNRVLKALQILPLIRDHQAVESLPAAITIGEFASASIVLFTRSTTRRRSFA